MAEGEGGLIGSLNFKAQSDRLDCILEPDEKHVRSPLTRMVATLGPNSCSVEQIAELLRAGMTVARFDFSYGSTEWHLEMQKALSAAIERTGLQCAIMLDILGTEVLVTNRDDTSVVELKSGQAVTLTCETDAKFTGTVIPVSLPNPESAGIHVGTEIFVGQYLFTGSENTSAYLSVDHVFGKSIKCTCKNDCRLEGRQLTVHIAEMERMGPVLAQHDIDQLKAWAQHADHIDYLSISFCRNASDVATCRQQLDRLGLTTTRLIAKIEDRDGLLNFESIIDAADGIIFSRGNLGIDLPAEKMFLAQKLVLTACNYKGKPVMISRLVDTMIEAPRPTRAEATDVANLVLDGADGLLCGAETWMGRNPALTVSTVLNIARQAELVFNHGAHYMSMMNMLGGNLSDPNMSKVEALASSAVRAADKLNASLIIAFTSTGRTARIIAMYRPPMPVLAVVVPKPEPGQENNNYVSSGQARARQALLYRGVIPVVAHQPSARDAVESTARQLEFAIEHAKKLGLVKVGDQVVVSQCPAGSDSGSVKVVQVEHAVNFSNLRLGSTADFSQLRSHEVDTQGESTF